MSLVLPPPHPWQPQPDVVGGVFFILGETCWSLASSYYLSVRGRQEVNNSLSPITSRSLPFSVSSAWLNCIHLFTQKPTAGVCTRCWEQKLVCFLFGAFSFQDGMKFWSHCVQVSLKLELQGGSFRTWRRWPKAELRLGYPKWWRLCQGTVLLCLSYLGLGPNCEWW